jgi:hypothetical protein
MKAIPLILVLVLAAPSWVRAQAAPQGPPEVFTGTASAKNAVAAASGKLEVRLRRITPEFDRKSVETALQQGGYPQFLTAIRNAPEVGQVVLAGGKPYSIRYARERADANGRTLILVTDQPMYFVGGGRAEAGAPKKGYEVAVIQIQMGAKGAGTGSMAAAARVRPDGDGGVLLDDFADVLITITDVSRKPS